MNHQFINLFRGSNLPKGIQGTGKPAMTYKGNNDIIPTELEKQLNESYNQGVTHCQEVAEKFLSQMPGISKPLIEKLEKLKSK